MPALSDQREEMFVQRYAVHRHGRKAMQEAGLPDSLSAVVFVNKKHIQRRLNEVWGRALNEAEVTPTRVLQELARVAFQDVRDLYDPRTGALLEPHELSDEVAATVSGIDVETRMERTGKDSFCPVVTKKIRRADKMAALNVLSRHFKIVGDDGEGVNAIAAALADRLESARKRAFGLGTEDARIIEPRRLADQEAQPDTNASIDLLDSGQPSRPRAPAAIVAPSAPSAPSVPPGFRSRLAPPTQENDDEPIW